METWTQGTDLEVIIKKNTWWNLVTHKREGEGSGKVMATDPISGSGNWRDDCVEVENAGGAETEGQEMEFSQPIIF